MKKEKEVHNLQPDFIYSRCQQEWWPALDAHKKIVHVKKGELIFAEGASVEGVYFVIDGVAKVHKHWLEDKELIVRFAGQNDIIGHRGLSSNADPYPISATALTKLTLCYLDLTFFYATLKVNPGLMFDLMLFFADELRLSEQRMRELAHMPVRDRVLQTLRMLEMKFGRDTEGFIAFAVSRQDIAAYTGAAYESVYKILAEFAHSEIIRTDGKLIQLVGS
ncbi:MAG: Crp/Fnr family transcriptional regulator [Chitinophagaceae bacterium]|nr:MAG: Crp/Fnr family transcriptional regulator [Chitinophagaceae bacterium]